MDLDHARSLLRQGDLEEAARRFAAILEERPDDIDALYGLAQTRCRQDRIADGIAILARALAAAPYQARLHNLLGLAHAHGGAPQAALASFDAALAIDPALAETHGARADALAALGRAAEALEAYDRALALAPQTFANRLNRGALLYELRRFTDAAAEFARAAAIAPQAFDAHFNHGNTLAALGRHDEALAAYDEALSLVPDQPDALYNRACLLSKLERYDLASAAFARLLSVAPDHPRAVGELAHCHLMACDWPALERLAGQIERAAAAAVIPPHTALALPIDPARLAACNARFLVHEAGEGAPSPRRAPAPRSERLRIAYLGDFNRHPVSYLMAGVFPRHDRTRFEWIGMAFGSDDRSGVRARIAGAFDRFLDAAALTDAAAAAALAELGVDIAVDLVGLTENARPGILARRPAPIQASYLGYLGSQGSAAIDYIIGDATVLPFAEAPFYREAIVQLPGCFLAQERIDSAARTPSRAEAGLPDAGFVFCSFNHSYKIRAPMFTAWMRILRAVPGSVLWLLAANPHAVANLRDAAAAADIDPTRLVFAARCDLDAHVARQRLADLFLDTLPYNAGATAAAALAAGVPLLTCRGAGMVGRMAASMLGACDAPELVATSLDDYVARAVALAFDPERRALLRRRLADPGLPLFDPQPLCRHLEAAYATMAERQHGGAPPAAFAVMPQRHGDVTGRVR